jgi:NAD-dependent deacetylase
MSKIYLCFVKKIVVFTGAGVSAESGIRTFRDAGGLWEGHDILEVASIEGWHKNPQLVQNFYNLRRKQLLEVSPNAAHYAIAKLEQKFEVTVITQNVDDLHERAGSTHIIHLHGELKKVKSTTHPDYVVTLDGWELKMGDKCPNGGQLRPHIVWFGELVPEMDNAINALHGADLMLVIGTSLQVYPAAGLVDMAPPNCKVYLIDPQASSLRNHPNIETIDGKAAEKVPEFVDTLLNEMKC